MLLQGVKWLLVLLVGGMTLVAPQVQAAEKTSERLSLSSASLVDQDGKTRVFKSDLIGDKVVAINFIFTSCSTICTPMTGVFSQLRKSLGPLYGHEVGLLSITLDAATDTPERLRSFAEPFKRDAGWTFVTGKKEVVDPLLQSLGGAVKVREQHPAMTLIVDGRSGAYVRLFGLKTPDELALATRELLARRSASRAPEGQRMKLGGSGSASDAAEAYFTNLEVVDQFGKKHRFYEDLIKGHKVMINFGFSTCKGSCSPVTVNLACTQALIRSPLEKEVRMLTLSVDPINDTPASWRKFTSRFELKPGWYFLSGSPENPKVLLEKLGGYTENPDAHNTVLYLGDARTGLWIKTQAMVDPERLADAIDHLNETL
ncbi:MAG: SCO family protein [Myxococcota bacterium]